nr:hypothetical protein [Nostoc commune]
MKLLAINYVSWKTILLRWSSVAVARTSLRDALRSLLPQRGTAVRHGLTAIASRSVTIVDIAIIKRSQSSGVLARKRNAPLNSVNESFILVDEPFILVNESFSSVHESFSSVHESLNSVNESLNSVNESFSSVNESFSSVNESFSSVNESFSSVDESLILVNE